MVVSLADMKTGEVGVVTDIQGGSGAARKIQNIGITVGKKIKKTGAHFRRGPQTLSVDNFNVAIGFGMASKILVEVKR
ncbi:MAG: hypothetical protein A2Z72_08235 [Omnitrophica bacterium RBG_13_46_9]|nr:MAG: hypothetical protein A2Z72_08235 [Omnitrophica bacterium RBG_13_46_9]